MSTYNEQSRLLSPREAKARLRAWTPRSGVVSSPSFPVLITRSWADRMKHAMTLWDARWFRQWQS